MMTGGTPMSGNHHIATPKKIRNVGNSENIEIKTSSITSWKDFFYLFGGCKKVIIGSEWIFM